MKVTLNGAERDVRPDAPVESLLAEEQRRAAGAGELLVTDAWGHRVGLRGALAEGGAYFTASVGGRPASVNACLEELGRLGGPALPGELGRDLVRQAIAAFRGAGGAASAAATAAYVRAAVNRRDVGAMWSYVGGEGVAVAVYPGGRARVADVLPGVDAAVVATRHVLTFRSGATTFDYLEGIRPVEVGTTNKVTIADYRGEFAGVGAAAICRAGDFGLEGFTAEAPDEELAAAAKEAGVPLVNLLADDALFDERRGPRRPAGDVVIWATPREARPFDFVFYQAGGPAAGNAALREDAAAELWEYLTED
jgi:hypothetical protein